ncbi:MAG: TlpA family protein disulfide reductase [Catonella sp.]|uniref:TlpA family protein disulfide reductase n=1 Tax=Catonella sp. TaxID=2382125 RepID=UPI003F9F2D01
MKTKMTIKRILPVFIVTAMLAASITACGNSGNSGSNTGSKAMTSSNKAASEKFPGFKGKDFDGNDVDESLFSKNEATLVNFWFNGCSACVNEMPALEEFNKKLKEKGAELIGINAGTASDEKGFAEAKEILSKQGATYRNLILPNDHEYVRKIFSFPTTVIVDKNGNIVGDPIVGAIEDEDKQAKILKIIDEIKAGNGVTSSVTSEQSAASDNPTAPLYEEENKIFAENQDTWNKLFSKIKKDQVETNVEKPYAEFLKEQLEASKADFTEDEIKTINEGLAKIDEIEKKIAELKKK